MGGFRGGQLLSGLKIDKMRWKKALKKEEVEWSRKSKLGGTSRRISEKVVDKVFQNLTKSSTFNQPSYHPSLHPIAHFQSPTTFDDLDFRS
jgi:hypothetical protein